MDLLQGIQLHELILMILGFILGLALIFIMVFQALKGTTNLRLLIGFIAPTVMIGYPSIQSMEFSKDVVKIQKLSEEVSKNPTDTAKIQELIQSMETLPQARVQTDATALLAIANAETSLGQYDKALKTINLALNKDPKNTTFVTNKAEIEQKIKVKKTCDEGIKHLEKHIKELEKHPSDKPLRDSIALNLNTIKPDLRLDEKQLAVLAKASAIVGETYTAEKIADNIEKFKPKDIDVKTLRKDISKAEIERKYGTINEPTPDIRSTKILRTTPNVETAKIRQIDTARLRNLVPKVGS